MDFVRSRKAQRVPSSASVSKQPQGKSSKDNFPLENVSRESDSSAAAVLFQKPQEVEMEGEEELPPQPPAAVTGMMDSKATSSSRLPCQLSLVSAAAAGDINKSTALKLCGLLFYIIFYITLHYVLAC